MDLNRIYEFLLVEGLRLIINLLKVIVHNLYVPFRTFTPFHLNQYELPFFFVFEGKHIVKV